MDIDREAFSKAVWRAYINCIAHKNQYGWRHFNWIYFKKRAFSYYINNDHKHTFLKLLRKNANVWSIVCVSQTAYNLYTVMDYNQQRFDVVNTPEPLWESKISVLRLCEEGTYIGGVGARSKKFLSLATDTKSLMVGDPNFFIELTLEERKADERQQRREAV